MTFTVTDHYLLMPRDLVQLGGTIMCVTSIHCDHPDLATATWTLDLTEHFPPWDTLPRIADRLDAAAAAAGVGRTATLTADWDAWSLPTSRFGEVQFCGLQIGDVVTRGKGKLLWRVTGLAFVDQPVVSLLSMPTGTGTSGLELSPQTFGCVGDAIATLKLRSTTGSHPSRTDVRRG